MYSIRPFHEVRTNPFEELMNISDFFSGSYNKVRSNQDRFSAYKNDDRLTIYAEIPGVAKDFVNIATEDNKVVVEVKKDENSPYSYETFKQEFTLSKHYDITTINAKMENGVLEISFEKKEDSKPKIITIS